MFLEQDQYEYAWIKQQSIFKQNSKENPQVLKTFEGSDFQSMQQTLGQGSFGWVTLVKEIKTGNLFAMKAMRKEELFKYCTVDNLKREIKIQRKLHHPNIIKLDSYFEDKTNVYLILEYAEGGSLFKKIKKERRLSEEEAFHYLYQTCLGIEYLHKMKIIHRDIKPENLLLDAKGNIKICDFGWSTEMDNLKKAFCGTIEYMAPEMIKSQSTNFKLDIWCLGVLLYEMVQGKPPFTGRNDQEKCVAILSGQQLKYEEFVSEDCKALIAMILQANPFNRPSIQGILNHKWMSSKSKYQSRNDQLNSKSISVLMDEFSHSPIKSCPTFVSERKTNSKEWEEMKNRSQHFVFHQTQPLNEQPEQTFFRRILISLGCINR
ncbi:unnamed protein product (macronuclear) [Paramecium tetraurelia]|uniref:Aurora kinase n=1 Tax=Paramecium tetraurelia TaxID=5888 RepID=A0BFM2_PARTE|nr:uncharacterized protein GSPATT00028374001 [Paramecium tetraurelia]CAK57339.1 unnamed protein product [Paramecium tetraurelia]|eukprot:XP_001424737.1 hypothetical protein (macronuclear) [Paramecium tetraurelia strain d4-2]